MEGWQAWYYRVRQELSSLPPCCFPSPIQWHQGREKWSAIWPYLTDDHRGRTVLTDARRVELYITMLVQSWSCQVGVEVQPHNKPCWHNGEPKVMLAISLICAPCSVFDTEWVKSLQFHTSSTDCVCVCACMCVHGDGEGKVKLRRDWQYISSLLSRTGGSQTHLILTSEG